MTENSSQLRETVAYKINAYSVINTALNNFSYLCKVPIKKLAASLGCRD